MKTCFYDNYEWGREPMEEYAFLDAYSVIQDSHEMQRKMWEDIKNPYTKAADLMDLISGNSKNTAYNKQYHICGMILHSFRLLPEATFSPDINSLTEMVDNVNNLRQTDRYFDTDDEMNIMLNVCAINFFDRIKLLKYAAGALKAYIEEFSNVPINFQYIGTKSDKYTLGHVINIKDFNWWPETVIVYNRCCDIFTGKIDVRSIKYLSVDEEKLKKFKEEYKEIKNKKRKAKNNVDSTNSSINKPQKLKLHALQKFYNKNVIIGYRITDGKTTKDVLKDDIKNAILSGKAEFDNLTLTADNRLVMSDDTSNGKYDLIAYTLKASGEYERVELIENTPQNISNFICSSMNDKIITDLMDRLLCRTIGTYIDTGNQSFMMTFRNELINNQRNGKYDYKYKSKPF